jgi:hypothetical protein
MEETWTGQLEGPKQGAERAIGIVFGLERGATIRALAVGVQIPRNLLFQQCFLDAFEELFGLGESQPEMLNTVGILLQSDNVGHRFFTAIIAVQDQLQFDAHGWAPPGGMGR